MVQVTLLCSLYVLGVCKGALNASRQLVKERAYFGLVVSEG